MSLNLVLYADHKLLLASIQPVIHAQNTYQKYSGNIHKRRLHVLTRRTILHIDGILYVSLREWFGGVWWNALSFSDLNQSFQLKALQGWVDLMTGMKSGQLGCSIRPETFTPGQLHPFFWTFSNITHLPNLTGHFIHLNKLLGQKVVMLNGLNTCD